MDETILPPSPNWFQVSGLAVSKDGWIVYGGPSKSLCVLEPLPAEHKGVLRGKRYHAHVFKGANAEKIVSVDISPEWPSKRLVLTGSSDGYVKHWSVDNLIQMQKSKPLLCHEIHSADREEVAGVSYASDRYAITAGCYGNLVRWDLNSNIVKTFTQLKNFKPLCLACSPHILLNVAVGTKQGVVFVLDLHGTGKILYKVRGQDDEIINLSWCPKFEVDLKKTLKESDKRAEKGKRDKDSKKQQSIANKFVDKEQSQSSDVQDTDPKELENLSNNIQEKDTKKKQNQVKELLDESGLGKNLPDDSFDASFCDDSIVPEDDMFDIYKDHEDDEFGHKKYQPEDIVVKVQEETKQDDYLAECLKLKEEILKRKTLEESSMQSLVKALDDTHVDGKEDESQDKDNVCEKRNLEEASAHVHKHLLATIGKLGGVRLWSKSGKLIGTCAVASHVTNKNPKAKSPNWPTVLWYKPDLLLIADGKSQLLECNPLKIDCKNKLDWSVVHTLHKRGLYCIASNAARIQTGRESDNDWSVYTVSQDRNIIQYSLQKREKVAVIATCGGYVYNVVPCPYDAGKVAVGIGDGAVRIWETSTVEDDETKLTPGTVTSFWQNVQGKVLVVAWHPTRENLLAFATAESRVGLLDVSKNDKPAKVLLPTLNGGIYSICWGEGHDLYACAGGHLIVYRVNKLSEAPSPVEVSLDGRRLEVSAVRWAPHALVLSSAAGAVAVLTPARPHTLLAATLVYSKMIYAIEWHPQQTSSSNEDSPLKNLLATCSCDKNGKIVILEYVEKEDGSKQLQTYKTLTGHKQSVLQIQWNPHIDGQLLSTSLDTTVRIWDVVSGACTSVFGGHAGCSLGAAWAARPGLGGAVLSGGGDAALRLWDAAHYPAEAYDDGKLRIPTRGKKKQKKDQQANNDQENEQQEESAKSGDQVAVKASSGAALKGPKKFLLPILYKPQNDECHLHAAKIMFQKYLNKTATETSLKGKMTSEIKLKEEAFTKRLQEKSQDNSGDDEPVSCEDENAYNFEYLKIFGSINDVNEILDKQMAIHESWNNSESWITLAIFRGHIDAMIQYASQKDMLCPYLLSIAPCVSYKYWKDATQLYLAQIDRLMATGEEKRLEESRWYGGAVYRKAAAQLSAHDARAAAHTLAKARLYREAYVLCRTRYMDSIAEETLKLWAEERVLSGLYIEAAICYLVLGDLPEAAKYLGKMNDPESLDLAEDIAKIAGQNMLVEHISEKRENMKSSSNDNSENTDEALEQLPSRLELMMREKMLNGESSTSDVPSTSGIATKE